MNESFEDWNDENSPYSVPEEIDLSHVPMKQHAEHSIGDVLAANGISESPNPMDVSALKSDDDMAPDADVDPSQDRGRLETTNEASEEEAEEETPTGPHEDKEVNDEDSQAGKNLEESFHQIYDKVLNDPNADPTLRKNLTIFMDATENARNAEKKVETAYITTEKLLEQSKTAVLEAAVPLYEHLTVHMEKAEEAILTNFSESHKLRKSILAKMDEFNKSWHGSFEALKKRLVCTGNEGAPATATPALSVIAEEEATENQQNNVGEEGEKIEAPDDVTDLDWDEITLLAPGLKECIENFLACREQWSNAVERFGKALDIADEKLCKRQQHMLEILANAHRAIFDNLAESKETLMSLFVENHIKREALEAHLARKALQQSKFFKRLMQSVKGPSHPKTSSTASDDQPVAHKSKRKKMGSIRKVFKLSKKRSADSQEVSKDE